MRCHSNCDDNTAGYVGRPSFPERLLLVLHIPSRRPQKDWLKKLFQKQKCCYFWSPGNQRKKRLYTTRKKLSKQARMAVGNFQKLSWWMTPFFISFPRWLLTKKGRNYTAITKENKYNSIKSLALFFARWLASSISSWLQLHYSGWCFFPRFFYLTFISRQMLTKMMCSVTL